MATYQCAVSNPHSRCPTRVPGPYDNHYSTQIRWWCRCENCCHSTPQQHALYKHYQEWHPGVNHEPFDASTYANSRHVLGSAYVPGIAPGVQQIINDLRRQRESRRSEYISTEAAVARSIVSSQVAAITTAREGAARVAAAGDPEAAAREMEAARRAVARQLAAASGELAINPARVAREVFESARELEAANRYTPGSRFRPLPPVSTYAAAQSPEGPSSQVQTGEPTGEDYHPREEEKAWADMTFEEMEAWSARHDLEEAAEFLREQGDT